MRVSGGRAFVVYTGFRILLLLAVGGVMYALGARGALLIVLAFVVSGFLSLALLDRWRTALGMGVARALERVNGRIDRASASEDHLFEPTASEGSAEGQPEAETEAEQQQAR